MKITEEMIHCAYDVTKKIYEGSVTRMDGQEMIVRQSGMNPGSANNYVQIILCMLDGQVYKRAMSLASTRYFLEQIGRDFGREKQKKAAEAVLAHTEYYAEHCNGQQVSTAELARSYMEEGDSRLPLYEKMQAAVQSEYDSICAQMEQLKNTGKTKSVTYQTLFGRKMMYKNMLELYKLYGL